MSAFADPSWIRPHLPFSAEENASAVIEYEDLAGNGGGLSGVMQVLKISWPDRPPVTFIQKTMADSSLGRSKALGNAREALFYNTLAKAFPAAKIPLALVIHAQGSMDDGSRTLVMEDLRNRAVQSGLLFGPGSPLNWGRDLDAASARLPAPLSAVEVAKQTFIEVAKMHRLFWMDKSLLEYDWLRGAAWLHGNGKDEWTAAQGNFRTCWTATVKKIASGESKVKWDSNLCSCADAALGLSEDWEMYQASMASRPWTLVHGDFHPGNIMWVFEGEEQGPLMLDWEMVGLGNGPQDLAQYLISHMNPALRRECEEELLQAYYAVLTDPALPGNSELTPAAYPYEQCKADYVTGGAQRWVWFMGYLSALCPDNMVQYFADQTAAFLQDHGITAETIGQPRV